MGHFMAKIAAMLSEALGKANKIITELEGSFLAWTFGPASHVFSCHILCFY